MIEFCNGQVEALEGDLAHYSECEEERIKLAALMAGAEVPAGTEGVDDACRPPTALQTRTVPLAMVRKNLENWRDALKAEYNQLVYATSVVRRIHKDDLPKELGFQDMDFAPSKLVATAKAPTGRHKANPFVRKLGGQGASRFART